LLTTALLSPEAAGAQERHEGIASPLAVKSFLGSSPRVENRLESPASNTAASSILFRVRTVQATGDLLPEQSGNQPRDIDPNLTDLAGKFDKLPFKTFRLVGSHEQIVPVKKKETIRLPNG